MIEWFVRGIIELSNQSPHARVCRCLISTKKFEIFARPQLWRAVDLQAYLSAHARVYLNNNASRDNVLHLRTRVWLLQTSQTYVYMKSLRFANQPYVGSDGELTLLNARIQTLTALHKTFSYPLAPVDNNGKPY